MTLIEAIKSGKRFRRAGQYDWLDKKTMSQHEVNRNLRYYGPRPDPYPVTVGVTVDDILAGDWEIEEPKKKTIVLYQWLTRVGNSFKITEHISWEPTNAIKRQDHSAILVEVSE